MKNQHAAPTPKGSFGAELENGGYFQLQT